MRIFHQGHVRIKQRNHGFASSITAGKAAAVDYKILDEGCNHKGKAFILANKSRKLFGKGTSKTKTVIKIVSK